MYYTHIAFGLLLSLLYMEYFIVENKTVFILVTVLFSIFPDMDYPKSKIGRKQKMLSFLLNFLFGHRGVIHSIWIPVLLFSVLLLLKINIIVGIAVLIGYLSHLFLDMLTNEGIRPFYPLYGRRLKGFIRTNSFLEIIIFLAIASLDFYVGVLWKGEWV